jgi:hypothetical protein
MADYRRLRPETGVNLFNFSSIANLKYCPKPAFISGRAAAKFFGIGRQSTRSGRWSALARLENFVMVPSNCNSTVPVGPWRCLPMMTSALP